MLTQQELDDIRQYTELATTPPWVFTYYDTTVTSQPRWIVDCNPPDVLSIADIYHGYGRPGEAEANAHFIAKIRQDAIKLLDHIREIESLLADLFLLDQAGA